MIGERLKCWAVVDKYGDVKYIQKTFPKITDDLYCIPVTMTLGHTWSEGAAAWVESFKAKVGI
jgi:hypothetical protein